MSYSDDVAKFMHVLGPFYEAVYDGQEPENLRLRRTPSPQPSDASAVSTSSSSTSTSTEKEDESGYSSSINGNCSNTGTRSSHSLTHSFSLHCIDLGIFLKKCPRGTLESRRSSTILGSCVWSLSPFSSVVCVCRRSRTLALIILRLLISYYCFNLKQKKRAPIWKWRTTTTT